MNPATCALILLALLFDVPSFERELTDHLFDSDLEVLDREAMALESDDEAGRDAIVRRYQRLANSTTDAPRACRAFVNAMRVRANGNAIDRAGIASLSRKVLDLHRPNNPALWEPLIECCRIRLRYVDPGAIGFFQDIQILDEVAASAERAGDTLNTIRSLRIQGECLARTGDPQQSLEVIFRAIRLGQSAVRKMQHPPRDHESRVLRIALESELCNAAGDLGCVPRWGNDEHLAAVIREEVNRRGGDFFWGFDLHSRVLQSLESNKAQQAAALLGN